MNRLDSYGGCLWCGKIIINYLCALKISKGQTNAPGMCLTGNNSIKYEHQENTSDDPGWLGNWKWR